MELSRGNTGPTKMAAFCESRFTSYQPDGDKKSGGCHSAWECEKKKKGRVREMISQWEHRGRMPRFIILLLIGVIMCVMISHPEIRRILTLPILELDN
jgi:hypothetical protein